MLVAGREQNATRNGQLAEISVILSSWLRRPLRDRDRTRDRAPLTQPSNLRARIRYVEVQ